MYKFIRRLLRFFTKLYPIYVVRYTGKAVSGNDFYAGGNGKNAWAMRSGIKAKYTKIFYYHLKEAKIPRLKKYALLLFFNSRHDVGNLSAMEKVFSDVLKDDPKKGYKGYVEDDSKDHNDFIAFCFDPTIPHNTFEFYIIKIK
jgi:hypothetical protein